MPYVPIFTPTVNRLRGMRSAIDPSVLPAGYPVQLTNLRIDGGVPRMRDGIAILGNSPTQVAQAAGTTYALGAKMFRFASASAAFFEIWNNTSSPTSPQIYQRNLTTGAVSELTSGTSTDKYGVTRFSTIPSEGFSFAVVRDQRNGKEYGIIQSGSSSDYPRIYDPSASSDKIAVHEPISPPQNVEKFAVIPTFPKYFTVNDETTTTLSLAADSANFTAADQGSAPENYIRFTRNTTSATNPTRTAQFTAAVDLSACPQLILLHDTVVPYWWDIVKLEIGTVAAGAFTSKGTVWDPANMTGKVAVFADPRSTRMFTAFPLDHIATTDRSAIVAIRLTYTAAAPSSSQTFDLYGIFGSGKVPGQSFHAVSYMNSGSRAESIALLCNNVLEEYCKNLGCASLSQSRIVNDEALFYQYKVSYLNTSTAQRDKGVDTLNIYRNEPGEIEGLYSLVTTVSLATWTPGSPGSWAFDSGSANSQRTTTDNTASESRNLNVLAPDSKTLPIPTGNCMISLNTRLVVGRYESGSGTVSSPNYSEVMISEDGNPFRFRVRQKTESGATRFTLTGEVARAFAKAPTSIAGVESAYLITNKNTYVFGGVTASELTRRRLVAPFGTPFPTSVAEARGGTVYFVDNTLHVRRLGPGGFENLTEQTIENKFVGMSQVGIYFSAIFANERYYLGYDASNANVTAIRKAPLVYDTRRDPATGEEIGWVEDDPAGAITTEFFVNIDTTVYVVSSDRYAYKYEVSGQTTDNGTAFTGAVTTGLLNAGFADKAITVRHIATLCEDMGSSGSVAYTRTYWPSGATQTSSALLDSATTRAWIEDKSLTIASGTEAGGLGCQIQAVYSAPGGKKIYGLQAEVEEYNLTPTASA